CGSCPRAVAADRLEPMMELCEMHAVERAGIGERALQQAQLPIAVEHVFDRRHRRRRRFLRDVRERPAGGQLDDAGIGDELAAYRREEARLARPVRADEADLVAVVYGEI